MSFVERLAQLFSVRSDNVDLTRAQFRAFSRQMPMMYFILVSSSWALASTHMDHAPFWLTVGIPILFTVVSALRMLFWWNTRNVEPDVVMAHKALSRTNRLSAVIALAFTAWAFALFPYGDAYARSHVAFYMAITVISCIFCLMYLRSAAIIVTAIVNGAFIVFFVSTAQPTFVAIAINVLLVCGGMLVVVFGNYKNFEKMVVSQQRTKALSDENFRLANLDSLTELPNRRSFFATLDAVVSESTVTGVKVVLGLLDLDGFKPVNDTYGHPAGDELLRQITKQLKTQLGETAQIFRLGGDEFALIFSTDDTGDALEEAYDVCMALREPFKLTACTARVSGTIGLAVFPDLAANAEELFERADYAMYRAKRGAARGEPWLFSEKDEAEIRRGSLVEQVLKAARFDEELFLMFQPIVDIETNHITGFEALARWASPELGRVAPAEFIPIAERSGLITHLTPVLFEKALAAAKTWPERIRLSFNLSVFDMSSPESLNRIMTLIRESGVNPSRIEFEITETAMVNDFAAIMAGVASLKLHGVSISLDDFGTGYSSLRQVHQLPLDKLKIDRSFVSGIHANDASKKIVKSLLSLCNDMKLACVVEGVETADELRAIRELGGQLVQGYFYGKPMPSDVIGEILADDVYNAEAVA